MLSWNTSVKTIPFTIMLQKANLRNILSVPIVGKILSTHGLYTHGHVHLHKVYSLVHSISEL